MKTIAIVIGVSNYQDSRFQTIPGAEADAERFASALFSWGLPKEQIHLVLNEEATKTNIIKTFFNCRAGVDENTKLILYFAGHGIRDKFIHHETPESCLALHDTLFEDPLFTGLRLIELMQLIRRLKPAQVFLFIDACSLRLNQIENPLNDGDILSTTNSAGLFCLLSSGIRKSYEDSRLKYGFFTKALLKSISELRHNEKSTCQDIVRHVSNSLHEQDLPIPEVYHIGYEKMWLLDHFHHPEIRSKKKDSNPLVLRDDAIALLQDHLVTTPDPVIWMWGESGMGKSAIAEQLSKRSSCTFYASIPNISGSYDDIIQPVIEQIRSQKSELFFNFPFDNSLYNILDHIVSFHPGSIFILDQLDRLLGDDLKVLISEIDAVPISCILVNRYPCQKSLFKFRHANVIDLRASSLNLEDVGQLISNGVDASFSNVLLNASKDNLLDVRKMLVKLSETELPSEGKLTKWYIRAMTAVVVCGGFLDELLFCQVFKLKSENLANLERLGLIHYTKEGCLPNDQLVEMVEEGNWPLDIEKACHYWNLQIQHTPYNVWACRSLVLMASQAEDCSNLKNSLSLCLETLNARENAHFLLDLVQIFKNEKWEELLVKSTDYLICHEEYHMAGEILSELRLSNKPNIRKWASLNDAKRLVWLGKAHECVKLYSPLLEETRPPEFIIPLRNALGISQIFLGNLDQAMEMFQTTVKGKDFKEEEGFAIANLMAGIVMTYRGESISKAKDLIERSLQLFESSKNYLWVANGLNGLSEITYRLERWHQSFHCLDKALELVQSQKNKTFLLFTIKNMARVYLRLDPNHHELSNLVLAMENFLGETRGVPDTWITSWIQNTLGTVYAHWNEIHKLKMIMRDVAPKTVNYPGTHIYTLSNLGHLSALENNCEQAHYYYQQAKTLAEQTKNQFALHEIKHNMIGCSLDKFVNTFSSYQEIL